MVPQVSHVQKMEFLHSRGELCRYTLSILEPVQVSLFRALNENEIKPKGGKTRMQFFLIVMISSFAYYLIPGYLFPSLSVLSFVCLIWKDSVTAQQIGSGIKGLGIGSFGLDWSTIASFLGSPLSYPGFAIANIFAGFVSYHRVFETLLMGIFLVV